MKFMKGQMVWCSKQTIRNLIVIDYEDNKYMCKGEIYKKDNDSRIDGWYDYTQSFYEF